MALDIFEALTMQDELRGQGGAQSAEGARPAMPGMARIYEAVTRPELPIDLELRRALRAYPKLRQAFDGLVARHAVHHVPRAAAAKTERVMARVAPGVTIELRPSRAAPGQVFVVIELADPGEAAPTTLFVRQAAGDTLKHALPPAQDGQIQLLLDGEDALVQALGDEGSEVFLS